MGRVRKPTKVDFRYIIRIFEVLIDRETYVEFKWMKAASSAIITIKEAKKYGFKKNIDDYLKYNEIIKINKMESIDSGKLGDMPKYFCTIEDCYKKYNRLADRDEHVLYSHIKKIKKGKIRQAIKDDKEKMKLIKKIENEKKMKFFKILFDNQKSLI
ncbi:hypothetical protein RhiirA5_449742 [Rhizophagus irregularis]|uniref:C2H2-type domain-containing protein n=1 Tax=Rhizophagus irregularis TaxID=588596 RepID=A0A2N0PB79_9GLOM|nr:hypothetical protein RhiirA5_449742 [Rhizophagus irregularis]CAB5205113.1 unnamed protein product [Rhizophagus irregularis]